ncbi:uncharacterized protein N7459_009816 [Penicillium hispanicum]|uniref:uncharacterized protein n=1 Tax=Penicillium hispanicum TaxID=1080232 RepID=UPI0025424FAE|nr:uncharacterized protein N7459_009816 [Penicillium hispanicum]KAJ5570386.1 hypothetical protein N7459_009816 [Penicillium hispanicum]
MPVRYSIFSRWASPPVELLQRSTMRAATVMRSAQTLAILRHQPLLNSPALSGANRRCLTTNTRSVPRATAQSRPGLRSIQLPRQRLNKRFNSGSSSSHTQAPKEADSLSQRLRTLSREYGWAALGVYLGLSALDFPFCFAAVRLLGVDRIGHFEHVVVESVKDVFRSVWPQTETRSPAEDEDGQTGLVRAEERNQEEASESSLLVVGCIWTQLALAYAIHKSFIFIRVPLTAAVTPKVVKVLRRWGWDIGKSKPKSS